MNDRELALAIVERLLGLSEEDKLRYLEELFALLASEECEQECNSLATGRIQQAVKDELLRIRELAG